MLGVGGLQVGGTSIEDVAVAQPEKIFKEPIDIMEGKKRVAVGWRCTAAAAASYHPWHQEKIEDEG